MNKDIDILKTYMIGAYVNQYKLLLVDDYEVLNAYATGLSRENKLILGECMLKVLD